MYGVLCLINGRSKGLETQVRNLPGVNTQFVSETDRYYPEICKTYKTKAPVAILVDEYNTELYIGKDIKKIKSSAKV